MTSQSRTIRSKSKNIVKVVKFTFDFLIVRVRVLLQVFQLQFMIEKPRPDLLTPFITFYDVSVLCNLFSKGNVLIGPKREPRHMRLSGTDGLNEKCEIAKG